MSDEVFISHFPAAYLQTVLQALNQVVDHPDEFNDRAPEITSLAHRAVAALETPFEAFQRLAYSALPLAAARIAQQQQILKALVENMEINDRNTKTTELAKKTGITQPVLESLLEYMATQDIVQMVTLQEYKPSRRSYMLLEPLFIDGIAHFHDHCLPAHRSLNSFLTEPSKARTAFEKGQNTDEDFYEWLDARPTDAGIFHRFMELQFSSLPTWIDVFDFAAECALGTTSDTPIFVDVGGGNGQQCASLQQRYPTIQGRIILQDRPRILANAITGPGVERMEHDFFTEQPVKGARAYYFRQIFHNHDHKSCVRILRSHLPAMNESSVLLIDDKVLSDEVDRAEYTAGLGVSMLCMFNALERRESQWRELLGEVGLRTKEIRRFTRFGDSVIVAIKG